MIFSKNGNQKPPFDIPNFLLGRVLALLDDTGSVTFFSAGFMQCRSQKLIILNDSILPKKFSSHINLIAKLFERSKPQQKRYLTLYLFSNILPFSKREINLIEDKKQPSEAKRLKSEDEPNHLPYWCSVYTSQAFPYVPQLKDSVVYFPAPHMDFLRRNGRKLKEKVDFDQILTKSNSFFEGTIEELEYIPDDIVKCKVVLKLMIGRKWTKVQFHYFFGINQPNFMVLNSVHAFSSVTKFKSNETIKIRIPPCQNENGIILELKEDVDALSSFGMYRVIWYVQYYEMDFINLF